MQARLAARLTVAAWHLRREDGQAMAEYGLLLALIAVVAIASLTSLGGHIVTQLDKIVSAIPGT